VDRRRFTAIDNTTDESRNATAGGGVLNSRPSPEVRTLSVRSCFPMNETSSSSPVGSEAARGVTMGRAWAAPTLASVLCLSLGATAIPALSVTTDELAYVCMGVSSWYGERDRFVPVLVLPVFAWVQNAPGAIYLEAKYGGLPTGTGMNILTQVKSADHLVLLRLARWSNLLFSGLGTIWIVWWAVYRWLGPRPAGAAALFAAIEPSLLSCYTLATNDAPAVPFTLLSLVVFDSYLRLPSPKRLLGAGALMGLGMAMKVSALPMGLLLLGACLVARVLASRESAAARRWLVKAAPRFLFVEVPAVTAVALMVSWAANGFLSGPALAPGSPNKVARGLLATLGYSEAEQSAKVAWLESLEVPAPLSVLRGQVARNRSGAEGMMFRGRVARSGPWYYYPYVFALKTHLFMLALGFVALARGDVRRSPLPYAALFLVALSCASGNAQGPRYFVTLYALWAAMAGAGTWVVLDLVRQALARNAATVVLAIGSLSLTLGSMPDFNTHTSPLWGGDWEGYRFADANFDWEQRALMAYAAVDKKGLDPVVYLYCSEFGVVRRRDIIFDAPLKPTDGLPPRLQYIDETVNRMRGRFVVVSLRSLYSYQSHHRPVPILRAFRALPPAGRLTKLYVYYDLRSPEHFGTFAQLVRLEIPYWVEEWEAARRAGMAEPGPLSADPRARRDDYLKSDEIAGTRPPGLALQPQRGGSP
jgi:hypothetical protein